MLNVARLQDRIPAVAELHRFILCTRPSGGTAHEGGGCDQSTGSTSLTSAAGCGRRQLGVPHWAISVDYCNFFIIDPAFCDSRFSTGRLLAIEDFTFVFGWEIMCVSGF